MRELKCPVPQTWEPAPSLPWRHSRSYPGRVTTHISQTQPTTWTDGLNSHSQPVIKLSDSSNTWRSVFGVRPLLLTVLVDKWFTQTHRQTTVVQRRTSSDKWRWFACRHGFWSRNKHCVTLLLPLLGLLRLLVLTPSSNDHWFIHSNNHNATQRTNDLTINQSINQSINHDF